jgi:3-deoxy-manno-octulosonate cytidylyltransferase (CMP-KDO synthetase)
MTSGVAVVLPARYHSSRFPGKPLAVLAGRPLIEWVFRRASQIEGVSRVVVATDHDQIASVVDSFGGEVVMTSADHATGTDRVAEVARGLEEDIIVNLQGDEPVFPPELIGEMIAPLRSSEGIDIVTACHEIEDRRDADNPNVVKVVMDHANRALYFSRSPIPSSGFAGTGKRSPMYRHIGIYTFHRESLLRFAGSPRTPLECAENLEQLRALENGMAVQVIKTRYSTVGVDSPEDIKTVEKALAAT